jgi:uncharacterized membrane protein YecN with MAPEG domain
MRIVPLYAALLALLFVALSVRTLRLRQRLRIAVGDAGDKMMLRAMRVHANFAEYVPLSLVLLYFVESTGASTLLLHLLCGGLLIGRLVHAYGVSQVQERLAFRVTGMALTLGVLSICAVRLLLVYGSRGLA